LGEIERALHREEDIVDGLGLQSVQIIHNYDEPAANSPQHVINVFQQFVDSLD